MIIIIQLNIENLHQHNVFRLVYKRRYCGKHCNEFRGSKWWYLESYWLNAQKFSESAPEFVRSTPKFSDNTLKPGMSSTPTYSLSKHIKELPTNKRWRNYNTDTTVPITINASTLSNTRESNNHSLGTLLPHTHQPQSGALITHKHHQSLHASSSQQPRYPVQPAINKKKSPHALTTHREIP